VDGATVIGPNPYLLFSDATGATAFGDLFGFG
jgi:hypothetical protein